MLRRLHSRIIGLGSVCGLPSSPPAEVFLKSLPPPGEVDPAKYQRFQAEERHRAQGPQTPAGPQPLAAPEPFYEVVAGAAGHKHVVLLTREGHLITFGENRYGQTAARKTDEGGGGSCGAKTPAFMAASSSRVTPSQARHGQGDSPDWAPLYIDLADAFAPPSRARVSCGANFTIVYQPGGRRAVAFGNNHVGQLGLGHKRPVDAERGFEEWDPLAPWWPESRGSVLTSVVSGYNHSIVQLSCGALFGFGSNTWGELSVGTTVSPMQPERITFFDRRGTRVRKAAAGNSFTLFLTEEGRVYGCGATNFGQLPSNAFEPVPVPLLRNYVEWEETGSESRQSSDSSSLSSLSSSSAQKLMRVKDIACVGNMAVYVSVGNEIVVQGSLPEYGVATHAPRLTAIDQSAAIETLKARMLHLGWHPEEVHSAGAFAVDGLVAGPSTLLVRFRNGCVGAMGANSEGQLHNVTKNIHGRAVNLAPSFSSTSLLPVFAPSPTCCGVRYEALAVRTVFLSGGGFTLLVDNDEVYPVTEHVRPIELPPGRAEGRAQVTVGGDSVSAIPTSGPGKAAPTTHQSNSGLSRRERLMSSLK